MKMSAPSAAKFPARFTLGVIGFGNMAGALVAGALREGALKPGQIVCAAHDAARDRKVRKKYGIRFAAHFQDLCRDADAILLAVKPQQMRDVLILLRPYLRGQPLLTVAAGLTLKYYAKHLGKRARVIRVMPNMPALIGLGAAGFFAGKNCTATDKKICTSFFAATGLIEEVSSEKRLDAVVGVSGSGPAFLYKYAESVIAGGRKLGLPYAVSRRLAVQTLVGAAGMLQRSSRKPAELIAQVASKKGTTLAGLAVLEKRRFGRTVFECMSKAVKRAGQIGREMEKL